MSSPNLPSGIIKKSLLVLDSFKAHKTSQVKLAFKDENSNLAIIPSGFTSVMAVGNFNLTKGVNIKKLGYNVICNWILEAWDSIPKEMVIKSFKKCGISNSMDGMEDHMIYESDGENNYEANYDHEVILKDDISAYGSDIEDNENNILSD
ncbi:11841_t:CDS:2 [Diversispora eburnea]|uniref:11841_t:CDS:1 n=1 Tax=Diversispora eburnea TaxID=1213867 RepID=A0A9N9CZG0_9GLOM|nr:11841_t:CDS:2 [Diversispora eburnea]